MKVAISAIAWEPHENERICRILRDRNITGVEIAPTKIWPDLAAASDRSIAQCRVWWQEQGLRIVALQSLLYGRPDLNIFGNCDVKRRTLEYLDHGIRIASGLGARVLVFGSPKNRRPGQMEPSAALDGAAEFFSELGARAHAAGVCIGLEPNPEAYGCDFIRTAREARRLVRRVASPGFQLHLDTAILTMNGEDIHAELENSLTNLVHLHISEPMLGVVGEGPVDHAKVHRSIEMLKYPGWISIEMRSGWFPDNTVSVARALDFVIRTYAPASHRLEAVASGD